MKKSTRILRTATALSLSFLLSLSTVLTVLCGAMYLMAHSAAFTNAVLRRSGYASHAQAELKEEFISYGSASNIDAKFFEDFFASRLTAEAVQADAEKLVRHFFAGTAAEADTAALQQDLSAELKRYAEEKGFTLDTTLLKNIETIAAELSTFYQSYLSVLSDTYFQTASQMLVRYRSVFLCGMGAGLLFLAASAALLWLSFQKRADRFAYFIYAFAGASLMLFTAPALALALGLADKISISSASLYSFATGMMKGALLLTACSAALPALCTALFAVLYNKAGKKAENTENEI